MTEKELIKEMPKGLIKWIQFKKNTKGLVISGCSDLEDILVDTLIECGVCVDVIYEFIDLESSQSASYDYVILSSAIESAKVTGTAERLLQQVRRLLKPNGRLFLLTDNRFGIRYFCGDRDPYTGRNFDGIEAYKRISFIESNGLSGKLYTKAELIKLLNQSGFPCHKFYSIFPELTSPQVLIADDYYPAEELSVRIFPQYNNSNTVFLEEENLYTSLIENKMFHSMANAYLVECAFSTNSSCCFEPVNQITVSMDRGKENALCTIISSNKTVIKKAMYEEGEKKLWRLDENSIYLQKHGINMIPGTMKGNSYIMPFVEGIPLVEYFRRIMRDNIDEFFIQLDTLWGLILHSSEQVSYEDIDWEHFDPWWDEEEKRKNRKIDRSKWRTIAMEGGGKEQVLGPVLHRGYIDLVLLNGFKTEEGMKFFDQEDYMVNIPARAIMKRSIDFLYHGDNELRHMLPCEVLYMRYGIDKYKEIYHSIVNYFLTKLRNDDVLLHYHNKRRRDPEVVNSNRQRMNYSTEEYLRLFVNIFNNIDNKEIYIFGSGNFSRKFLSLYSSEYEVTGILDNNEAKWGERMEGIEICSPEILRSLDASTYKVIICIKNYVGVLKQIKALGATNIGIYDTNLEYPRKPRAIVTYTAKGGLQKEIVNTVVQKKYHIGYIAGVFDLFHMGHLNLLRRAKEQCDYLIVGVVTDEGVIKNKKTTPFIPIEERLAIVEACRYVDEAVAIPLEFFDTKDAYLKFQFDVQFSGSDYYNDPDWIVKREFLNKRGAELVFFPYTESTSSTKIKAIIDKKLM